MDKLEVTTRASGNDIIVNATNGTDMFEVDRKVCKPNWLERMKGITFEVKLAMCIGDTQSRCNAFNEVQDTLDSEMRTHKKTI